MADLSILIKAMNEASPEIDEVNRSLGELGPASDDMEGAVSDSFGTMMDNINITMLGIFAAIEIGKTAFEALQNMYEGTVGKALDIAGEIEELMRVSGEAPEKLSALRIEAEKADVPFDDLYKAMENLNKNGVAPTIDNLVAIADEYVRLQDPIAQAALLTENFGSAGDEIAPMLEAIAGGVEAVQDVGPIFTEEDLQAARDHEEAVANLKLAWDDFATTIGQKVIPVLTNMFNQITDSSAISDLREQLNGVAQAARDAGIITRTEYNNIMFEAYNRSKTTGEAIEYLETTAGNLTSSLDDNASATNGAAQANGYLVRSILANSTSWRGFQQDMEAAGLSMKGWTEASYNAEKGISAAGEAAAGASGGMQAMADATNNANEAMKAYSEALLFKIASEGLSESGALALAGAMGLVDQKTVAATQQVNFYQDLLAAGVITQAEYNLLIEQLATDLENVPEETPVEVTTNVEEVLDDLDDLATWRTKPLLVEVEVDDSKVRNWQPPSKTGTITYTPVSGSNYAAGGAIHAAASGLAASLSSYWVGERGPEPFFPAMDGRIVSNTQAMAALRGGAGANAREIANAVRDGVREAMRDERGGNVYNLTMPTSSNPADVRTAFELMEAWGA